MVRSDLLVSLALPLLAVAQPTLQARADSSSFGLYAYGDGISGLSLINDGGFASLGDPSSFNTTTAGQVLFSISGEQLQGTPNTTTSTPNWSNVTMFVPSTSSSSHRVGFSDSSDSNSTISTTGFFFFGSTLMYTAEDGTITTAWYVLPGDSDNVFTLNWNNTDNDASAVPVTLGTNAPSQGKLAVRAVTAGLRN